MRSQIIKEIIFFFLFSFLFEPFICADNVTLTKYQYWFDTDILNGKIENIEGVDSLTLQKTINIEGLKDGLHSLNYRFCDSNGNWSVLDKWLFFVAEKKDTTNAPKLVEYWFDNNLASKMSATMTSDSIKFSVDASSLVKGLHTLSYRTQDALGYWSSLEIWPFFNFSRKVASHLISYKYWWNDHYDKATNFKMEGDSVQYTYKQLMDIPEYALHDALNNEKSAIFHIVFCDDLGNQSAVLSDSIKIHFNDKKIPVTTLKAESNNGVITLTWTSVDLNEILDYNVYVSEDDQPFALWHSNTKETKATFKGQSGVQYRFIVTARDEYDNSAMPEEINAIKVVIQNK